MVCAFTGHRPERLPWGVDESDQRCLALKKLLLDAVVRASDQGFDTFLCGMARGCDFYFAECVLAVRVSRPHIQLIAMIPCPSQTGAWDAASIARYQALLDQCSQIIVNEPVYTDGCMLRRNRRMVDASRRIITVFDGSEGGTAATVRYAEHRCLDIDRIWY